ncbi:MAG: hypothetical protein J6M47_07040 [Clostridia bacterium]|nr:hypothetical protein [Clostridia bacterium]
MKEVFLIIAAAIMFVFVAHMMHGLDITVGEKRRKRKRMHSSRIYAGRDEDKGGE